MLCYSAIAVFTGDHGRVEEVGLDIAAHAGVAPALARAPRIDLGELTELTGQLAALLDVLGKTRRRRGEEQDRKEEGALHGRSGQGHSGLLPHGFAGSVT